MATDSARQSTAAASNDGLLARLGGQLRQMICGLHGHDELLHFEQGRISLQCVSCGYQSPGWEVKQGKGRPDHPAAAAPRARILRLPLVNDRRVA
jgi:hypothetical protein